MSTLFEVEHDASRSEAAEVLRAIAAGVERGAVELTTGEGRVAVDVPEDLAYELELETAAEDEEGTDEDATGGDGSGEGVEVELEVELEWPAGPDAAVAVPSSDRESSDAGADSTDEGDEAEAPAAAFPVAQPTATDSAATFELFTDRADEWRWRLVHDNGNVVADSGEGYTRKASARKGLESVRTNAPGADVVEVGDEE